MSAGRGRFLTAGGPNVQRRTFLVAATTAVIAQAFAQGAGEPSRALLIGNSTYRPNSQKILTARKNLQDIDDALRELGYSVESVADAGKTQMLAALDAMLASVAPDQPAFIYFCGHGINSLSRGEYRNYWVAANLELAPPDEAAKDPVALVKHYESIAQQSASLEDDVFSRVRKRPKGITFVIIDACRDAASNILDLNSNITQSLPPPDCLVSYATRPGRYAYTPRDENRNSYFAESLVRQLRAVRDEGDMKQLLERVRLEVRNRVNGIAQAEGILKTMLGQLGLKDGYLQEPEFASGITGRAALRSAPQAVTGVAATAPAVAQEPAPGSQGARDAEEWTRIEALADQAEAEKAAQAFLEHFAESPLRARAEALLQSIGRQRETRAATQWARIQTIVDIEEGFKTVTEFLARFPASPLAANATIRLEDMARVRDAARRSRVLRVPLNLPETGPLSGDYRAALQGDKFAAHRVAAAIRKAPALGDTQAAQRWLQFSAELGNGIAAYEVAQIFNGRNLVQEASYYLALAKSSGYRPPRDFDTQK